MAMGRNNLTVSQRVCCAESVSRRRFELAVVGGQWAVRGDVVVVLSCLGPSPNICEQCHYRSELPVERPDLSWHVTNPWPPQGEKPLTPKKLRPHVFVQSAPKEALLRSGRTRPRARTSFGRHNNTTP